MPDPLIQYLRAELIQLKQAIAQRPIRVPTRGGVASNPTMLQAQGGNEIITSPVTWVGVDWEPNTANAVEEVNAIAPSAVNTYAKGLGWGYLYATDGTVLTANRVWIVNGAIRTGPGSAGLHAGGVAFPLMTSTPFWSLRVFRLPVTATSDFTSVYQVYRA